VKYLVTRQRAYWVEESQVVEADTPEEAEDRFLDWFDPTLEIQGVVRLGNQQLELPFVTEAVGRDE